MRSSEKKFFMNWEVIKLFQNLKFLLILKIYHWQHTLLVVFIELASLASFLRKYLLKTKFRIAIVILSHKMVFNNNNNKELVELTIHSVVQLLVFDTTIILRLAVEVFYTYLPFSHLRKKIYWNQLFSRIFLVKQIFVPCMCSRKKQLISVHLGTTVLICVYTLLFLYYRYKDLHFQILS